MQIACGPAQWLHLTITLRCLAPATLQHRAGPGRGHADHGAAPRIPGQVQGTPAGPQRLLLLLHAACCVPLAAASGWWIASLGAARESRAALHAQPAPDSLLSVPTPCLSTGGLHPRGPPAGAGPQALLQRRLLPGPQVSARCHRLLLVACLQACIAGCSRLPGAPPHDPRMRTAALPWPPLPACAPLHCPSCHLLCSTGVMDRALMHADCTYRWPAFRARGWVRRRGRGPLAGGAVPAAAGGPAARLPCRSLPTNQPAGSPPPPSQQVCRTNQASHTAFRGYGGPQARPWLLRG